VLITDHFVVLNLPKTGSTFVRRMLKTIHKRRMKRRDPITKMRQLVGLQRKPLLKELILANVKRKRQEMPPNQHGAYEQIPLIYRDRPVVSVVRNPYDRLLSLYEFRGWMKRPPLPADVLNKHFPNFPELSLDDFCRLEDLALATTRIPHITLKAAVGKQTVQFIQMFFKRPDDVLRRLDESYMNSERFVEDIADIVFLTTERLNQDLAGFLERHGFAAEDVAFVRQHEKIHVTKNRSASRDLLWTPKALRYVAEKERFLFKMLSRYGFSYSSPRLS